MAIQIITATILAGQSESDVLDFSVKLPTRIMMPPAWTSAVMTLLISNDGTTSFANVVGPYGTEIMLEVIPGTSVPMPQEQSGGFLKLRSGTSKRPVLQAADREFKLVVT